MYSSARYLRLILTFAFPLFVIAAGYYRIRSQATGEKLDRRQEGWPILLTLRPIGAAGMFGAIAYLIDPSWMAWSSVPLPLWLRWTGLIPTFMGMFLVLWAFRSLGRNLTDTVVTRQEHALITTGPYVWVRHPFYSAVACMTVGASLVIANWFVFAAGLVVFPLLVIRTQKEEANLVARFGNDYSNYMSRTGRFFPKLS